MKLANSDGRVYKILNSKNNVIAAWTHAIKPIQVVIGGETVNVYGDPLRSNYIYFLYEGIARCIWAKDRREFDFLNERKLDPISDTRSRKPRAKPSPKPKAVEELSFGEIDFANVPIGSFEELYGLFEKQVARDNKTFDVESIYLPNPRLTSDDPECCLVAMEPSLAGKTLTGFRHWVARGFVNFVYYETDLILHYCAYKYLCGGDFKYHITDISKGAMNTRLAANHRSRRYANWLSILRREMEFLGNPKLIAVGRTPAEFLRKYGSQSMVK